MCMQKCALWIWYQTWRERPQKQEMSLSSIFFFRVDRKIGIIGESKGRGVLGMRASLLVRFSFNFMQFSGETCQNKRLEMAPSLTRPSAKSWIRPTDPSSSSRSGSCHYHPSPNHHNPGPGKICFSKRWPTRQNEIRHILVWDRSHANLWHHLKHSKI